MGGVPLATTSDLRGGEGWGERSLRTGRLWGVRHVAHWLTHRGARQLTGRASRGALRRVLYQAPLGAFSPGFSPLLPLWVLATFKVSRRHTGLSVCPPGGSFKAQVLKEGGENQPRRPVRAPPPGTARVVPVYAHPHLDSVGSLVLGAKEDHSFSWLCKSPTTVLDI